MAVAITANTKADLTKADLAKADLARVVRSIFMTFSGDWLFACVSPSGGV